MTVATEDCTRDEVACALAYLNATAKDMRRKGYIGIASQAYARTHGYIDDLLDTWLEMA